MRELADADRLAFSSASLLVDARMLAARTVAPAASSSSSVSVCPWCDAMWSGVVSPSEHGMLTSARASMSRREHSLC
eukprot:319646-Prymnesium_polylepis.2